MAPADLPDHPVSEVDLEQPAAPRVERSQHFVLLFVRCVPRCDWPGARAVPSANERTLDAVSAGVASVVFPSGSNPVAFELSRRTIPRYVQCSSQYF